MKSAYELAMERLDKAEPKGKAVTAEQKKKLGELDTVYQGKIAEREIFLKQALNQALVDRNAEEVDQVKKQMASERARLEEERDHEKDKIRSGK